MRKIHKDYIYTPDFGAKQQENDEYLKELEKKYTWVKVNPPQSGEDLHKAVDDNKEADLIYCLDSKGYAHDKFRIIKRKLSISDDEIMLIVSNGQLLFGCRREGKYFIIHTD